MNRSRFLALAPFALALTACGGGEGRISVLLTDAPGDFQRVPIEIARVEVSLADGDEEDVAGDNETGMSRADDGGDRDGWITLVDEQQSFDLLELRNGVTAALGEAGLPEGRYNQIRLILADAAVVVDDVEYDLMTPSAEQTGFKINADFDIQADVDYELTLDFDAAESIREVGQSYLLTPVLRVLSFGPVTPVAE